MPSLDAIFKAYDVRGTVPEQLDVELVLNEDFTSRVNELAALASTRTKQSGDDAFRFLQLLTHLRGNGPTFGEP